MDKLKLKKLSVGLSALAILALCCAASVKKPQAAPQELTVITSKYSEAPITVTAAQADSAGLTVTVRNNTTAAVEYFEFHLEHTRVWSGRCTIDTRHTNHPKFADQAPLSLAPGETRTFDFAVKEAGTTLRIHMVLLADGRGYMGDGWMRKLDPAPTDGILWRPDLGETEKHRVKVEYPRNVGKTFNQGYCLRGSGTYIDPQCDPPSSGSECRKFQQEYEPPVGTFGTTITYLSAQCYRPFESESCGTCPFPYSNGVPCE